MSNQQETKKSSQRDRGKRSLMFWEPCEEIVSKKSSVGLNCVDGGKEDKD